MNCLDVALGSNACSLLNDVRKCQIAINQRVTSIYQLSRFLSANQHLHWTRTDLFLDFQLLESPVFWAHAHSPKPKREHRFTCHWKNIANVSTF